jgi:hypothetical protein
MQRLFEPFFRGDVRDSRQGLGLGLHIASQIAQAHGGRIDVTSTLDETRFVFTMPLSRTASSCTYESRPWANSLTRRNNTSVARLAEVEDCIEMSRLSPVILIVEDELLIRMDSAEAIENAGFEVDVT